MSGSGSLEVRTPIFWRIKMVMIFKSLRLWNLVEKGITTPDSKKKKEAEGSSDDAVDEEMTVVFMKDAKALGIIQNAVSDQIFPRIANAESAKMAWDLLYGEYHGGDQVRSVKLQNLKREFEYARMRDDESLPSYLTRLNELINQMRTFGESLSNKRLVQKVLISLMSPNEQNRGGVQSGSSQFQKNWNHKGNKWDPKLKFQQKFPANSAHNAQSMGQIGFGTLVIDTSKGRKYVKEVMYLPGLKENLLSVGQMDEHGYYLVFGGKMCSIFDGPSLDCLVLKVEMKKNRCYPLTLVPNDQVVLRASISKSTWVWHKRLGHVHFRGLQQLKNKEMVHGLPVL
ncbi:uncharacterized protein [Malus domestica]|uniref:uncharacterized protein n=1 Tax=Malus domestica TaxID=3750 RepID=UPI003976D0C1